MQTPKKPHKIEWQYIVPIIAALISAAAIILAALVPRIISISPGGTSNSTTTVHPTASTPTSVPTVQDSCPLTYNLVAQLMGVPEAEVRVTPDERNCSFKLDAVYIKMFSIRQAHCANGYGLSSVEMERVQPHRFIVITCTGNNDVPLQDFYEAVVRFETWNPNADACTIAQQHWLYQGKEIDFPQGCPVPS